MGVLGGYTTWVVVILGYKSLRGRKQDFGYQVIGDGLDDKTLFAVGDVTYPYECLVV